jgi:hypothetical protein
MNPPPLPSEPLRPKRPEPVKMLFLLFCIGVPIGLIVYGAQLLASLTGQPGSMPLLDIFVGIVCMVVRGIGMVRLFLMKADAWLYLLAALIIGFPISVMNVLGLYLMKKEVFTVIFATAVGYGIAIAIMIYAKSLFRRPKNV